MLDDFNYSQEWSDCWDYIKMAEKNAPLKAAEERPLLEEYFNSTTTQHRKQKIKDEIIIKNLRIILKTARSAQYAGKGIPIRELVHEGIMGLMYCLDRKYDLTRGNRLLTPGLLWIRQFIGRSIENKSKIVKLPLGVQARMNKVRTVYREFIGDGERPSPEQIIVRIKDKYNEDYTIEEVEELGRFLYDHCSLDDSPEDGQSSMLDLISDNNGDDIHEQAEATANKEYVENLVKQLNKEQAKLVTWKFGLIDLNTKRTTKEMASLMGLDLTEYKKLEAETMTKLRSIADINQVCW